MTHMMYENKTKDARIYISSKSIIPEKPGDNCRYDETDEENQLDVMLVLPPHDGALAQIADVRHTRLTARLQKHPTYMRVPETLMGIVRVEVSVGIAMVRPVTSGPPLNGAFHSSGTSECEIILQRN